MAKVALPVNIDAAETAHLRLGSWLDAAEAGEHDVAELDSALVSVTDLIEEQRNALHRATER